MQEVKKQYVLEYPIAFHTTDFALVRKHPETGKFQVLMIQKSNEVETNFWRFPGGFVDPKDDSIKNAAKRELKEETCYIAGITMFVTDSKIDDPRYRDSDHAIFTSFFVGIAAKNSIIPEEGLGTDDAAHSKWFDMNGEDHENKLSHKNINTIHKNLINALYSPKNGWKKVSKLLEK